MSLFACVCMCGEMHALYSYRKNIHFEWGAHACRASVFVPNRLHDGRSPHDFFHTYIWYTYIMQARPLFRCRANVCGFVDDFFSIFFSLKIFSCALDVPTRNAHIYTFVAVRQCCYTPPAVICIYVVYSRYIYWIWGLFAADAATAI